MPFLPFREISVFEPDLRAPGSHHFEYMQLLRGAASRAGLSMRIFGHRGVEAGVAQSTGAQPLFADWLQAQTRIARILPWRSLSALRSWLTTSLQNRLFAREFRQAFAALDWDRQLILVPNCHQAMVGALARTLREPLRRHPSAQAVLVFPYLPSRHMFRRFFRELIPLIRAGRVMVATDSEPLAKLYLQLTGFTFPVLPMPYGAGEVTAAPRVREASEGAHFLICGGYRMEKGTDLLAALIEGQEAAIAAGTMKFTFQGFTNETSPEPLAALHFERIKAAAARVPQGIAILERTLDSTDYHRLFERCDVVLLPYRRGAYSIRTSGVLTEALARAKPVLATADTWLGEQVERHGSGLVFPDGDVPALARATLQLAAELPRFSAEAVARQPGWVAYHNPDNYLRVLTGQEAATLA